MQAVVVTRAGGPDALEYREWPDPQPGAGQLLVEVEAAGVNYRDIYEREGTAPGPPPPFVAGIEGAGTVVAVGDGVAEFRPGDRVAWASALGSYAERALVDAASAVPVPDGISSELAAAAILQGMTAHYLACSTYPVQPGDDVLIHAVAGGVGLLLTQIVKLRGGRVIGTTSNEEKAALARRAGADEVIGYEGCAQRVRDLTGGRGVAVVYDGVGRATFEESLAALRVRGVLAVFGRASGPAPAVEPGRLSAAGSLYVAGAMLRHYTLERRELLERSRDVFSWIEQGKLTVHVGGRYPLAQAAQAQSDLAGRRTTGKLVLLPR